MLTGSQALATAAWVLGVLPLAGVVLGAASTGWVSWWFARRTEEAEYRQARRRVAVELGRLAQDLGAVLNADRRNVSEGFFETHIWHQEQAILARHMDEDSWETLAVIYEVVKATDQLLDMNLGKSLPRDVADRCRRLVAGLNESRVALGAQPVPVSGVTPDIESQSEVTPPK